MNEDIRNYAKLGLVHHMLHPNCVSDPEAHIDTLLTFVQRDDMETFDCCLPYGEERRRRLAPAIRDCGKSVCFAIHFYPFTALPLTSASPIVQSQSWMILDDMIQQAAAIGAEGFIFAAGPPAFHAATQDDFAAFDHVCATLCDKLKPHGITALLEPFDFTIDKKFLYGPIDACVELAKRVTNEHDNFGFELDMAHLPLMGEDFTTAIQRLRPWLKRVHLGNCVLKDKTNPRWGDTHPPIGFPGGEIDVKETTIILRGLLETGYLNTKNRGALVLETTPFPDKTPDETIADNIRRLRQAWDRL